MDAPEPYYKKGGIPAAPRINIGPDHLAGLGQSILGWKVSSALVAIHKPATVRTLVESSLALPQGAGP